jgi:5'-nucleotidase
MKRLIPVLILVLIAGCSEDDSSGFDLVILHTNDDHSHFHGLPNCEYDPAGNDGTEGGIARLATLIDEQRAAHKDVLLVSAGDFTMGTMLVAAEDTAADLNFMKYLGYDAAALGNHEFDWKCPPLAQMIEAAEKPMIPLLAANLRFGADPDDDTLEALVGQEGETGKYIFPYIVREMPSGTKVGMLGLMGLNAADVSRASPAFFSDSMPHMAQVTQEVVDTLRDDEKVDVVIAVGHLGMKKENDIFVGDTIELGKLVNGIDVIISGHTHTPVNQIVEIPCEKDASWTTFTLEAGSYRKALGKVNLVRKGGKRSATGELVGVFNTVAAKEEANQRVDSLVTDIETNFLPQFPLVPDAGAFLDGDYFQVLATSDFDIPEHGHECNNLGYLIADAMREDSGAQMAAVSNGEIRRDLMRVNGDQFCLPDSFMVAALGIGPDGILGYPLVTFYLTLFELKLVLDATTCERGLEDNDYMLPLSGLKIECDSSQASYGKLMKMTLYDDEADAGTVIFDADNGGFLIDQMTLMSITTSIYIAENLTTFNLNPKHSDGTSVEDLEDIIVRDAQGREIKLWYSFLRKLASFPDKIPAMYNDDEALNPYGPYWRRCFDRQAHP